MFRKVFLGLLLTMLLTFAATPSLERTRAAWTGSTIYIRADGSIEPSNAPITTSDGITYFLTDDVEITSEEGIVVEKDNIILDGKNHSLTGGGWGYGIMLENRVKVTIRNIRVKNFYWGIYLYHSSNNTIVGNTLSNNKYYGIYFYSSSSNTIFGNTVSNNNLGIYLGYSFSNTIASNVFTCCGLYVSNSYGNTVRDNTVNGKPLVYLENARGLKVSDAGQIILVKCSGIRVENLNLSYATVGVELWESKNSIIVGNTFSNNQYGISLKFSSNNTIVGNIVSKNNYHGIYIDYSSNNTITGNIFSNNECGIYLYYSSNNTIVDNTVSNKNYHGISLHSSSNNIIVGNIFSNNNLGIPLSCSSNNTITGNIFSNNDCGISLYYSSNNRIRHNIFISNTFQVLSYESINSWDDGSRGNYWSDYMGVDSNNDGVGDTPYVIDNDNRDRYPLMTPPGYLVKVLTAYGSATGSGIYQRGATATISISQATVDHGNGTRRVFRGWYEDGKLLSGEQRFSIVVDRPMNIVAHWDTEYLVSASSPYGSATGSGWYVLGETATVSITPTATEDFFTSSVFEGWRINGNMVSTSPTYSFIVNKPVTIAASWKTETKLPTIGIIIGAILLIIIIIILIARRRKQLPPP